MGEKIHVAAYGTLKQGHANYERHLAGERPVLATVARLPYRMYANDDYPMLVPAFSPDERHPIAVEVFAVTREKLEELDALELPYGYQRQSVRLDDLGGDVQIYVYPAPPPPGFSFVPGGEWGD